MRKILTALLLLFSVAAPAQVVNWPDTQRYIKPRPYLLEDWAQIAIEGATFTLQTTSQIRFGAGSSWVTLTLPSGTHLCSNALAGDPAVGVNKTCQRNSDINVSDPAARYRYYVTGTGGSGTECSALNPCGSMDALTGKPGLNGTGAEGATIIYVSGTLPLGSPELAGSPTRRIFIRPLTNAVVTFTGNATWTQAVRHVVFDGGPNMRILFQNASSTPGAASITLNGAAGAHESITFFRVRWSVTGAGDFVSVPGRFTNLSFINNEFRANTGTTSNDHAIRITGTGGASTGLYVRGNTFRDIAGHSLIITPSVSLADRFIEDNVGYNLGVTSCGTAAGCGGLLREAVTGSGVLSGTFRIASNVIWNTGSAALRLDNQPNGALVVGNTIAFWGNGASASTNTDSAAVRNAAFTGPINASFANNIFYATGNDANGNPRTPFSATSSGVANNNACISAVSCGTTRQIISAASFASLTVDSRNYLQLASGSTPINNGVVIAGVARDYTNKVRNIGGTPDIGAFEFGTGLTAARPRAVGGAQGVNCEVSEFGNYVNDVFTPGAWVVERQGVCNGGATSTVDFESQFRLVTRQPGNGGASCPVLSQQRQVSRSCPPTGGGGGGPTPGGPGVPFVNVATIPPPAAGTSSFNVRSTTQVASPSDIGAFRTVCGTSHYNFDDFILFPNQPGVSHLHVYAGNTATNANSTSQTVASSGNSTCRGGIANRSAYWWPAVVDSRNGTVMPMQDAQVYYKGGYNQIPRSQLADIPNGLRFITGRPSSASGPPAPFTARESIKCVETNYDGFVFPTLAQCPVGSLIQLWLEAPNCWDGVNLTSPDGRSHMASSGGGVCPSSHPVPLTQISLIAQYRVRPGDDPGFWRLTSDSYSTSIPGGYSLHADLVFGWDIPIMQTWMQRCNRELRDGGSNLLCDGREIF